MTDDEFRALVAAGPAVVMVEKGHMIGLLDERDRLAALPDVDAAVLAERDACIKDAWAFANSCTRVVSLDEFCAALSSRIRARSKP